MGKSLFIAEKPSVAMEFAAALGESFERRDGYQESERYVVTWCVGHLITMSYPEVYDPKLKRWSLQTLPFIPDTFLYEVIPSVKKQFSIVKGLLLRGDVDVIYVCTDSGREGESIYRLVAQEAHVTGKVQKRVWIDSQTREEILRGIAEAKDLSAYDDLAAAAYLRAQEDYLMGINFSRLLTLKYGDTVSGFLGMRYCVISVGRVMTCVLGMVVRREREIRGFVKQPFYRVLCRLDASGTPIEGEFRAVEGSAYYQSPLLYKENGFKEKKDAAAMIESLKGTDPFEAVVVSAEKKKEKKNPPLLYNLAELQNDCSKMFRISPDETLRVVQELYEKKLVTYPRTDARVLSSAVAKEIGRNLGGLKSYGPAAQIAAEILSGAEWKKIGKTRYTDDKQITDHYAIIPTGQGFQALGSLSPRSKGVYDLIVRRFLGIFLPPAVYLKVSLITQIGKEKFFTSLRVLLEEGYLKAAKRPGQGAAGAKPGEGSPEEEKPEGEEGAGETAGADSEALLAAISRLRKGSRLPVSDLFIKEGETTPPKRYSSGSMILAMENAGQLIEDEQLREQIRGSGIGTSATRAEILKKLVSIGYLQLNKKTQILTPTQMGEMIYDVVDSSLRQLLNPDLTASWEKGLTYVAQGEITPGEYRDKLDGFIRRRTSAVMGLGNQASLRTAFAASAQYYKKGSGSGAAGGRRRTNGKKQDV